MTENTNPGGDHSYAENQDGGGSKRHPSPSFDAGSRGGSSRIKRSFFREGFGFGSRSGGAWLAIWLTVLDGEDEAIAELRKGFDKAGFRSGVVQNAAKFLDGGVQAVLEVHKGIRGPELLTKLFASNDIARVAEQKG